MPAFTHTHKVGNSLTMPLQVRVDGVDVDLTGKTVVYRLYAADRTTLVLEFAVGSGLEVTDAVQGLIELTATRATMTLDPGTYYGITLVTDAADPAYRLELPEDGVGADLWTLGDQLAA